MTPPRGLRRVAAAAALALAGHGLALAQVTLYEHDGYAGRSVTVQRAAGNLGASGFNDRASSVVVTRDRWEVCDDANYAGYCRVLRPGNYPSLSAMGLNDRISSVRLLPAQAAVGDDRYSPPPAVAQDFRRRDGERLFQANVTAVHAVVGAPEQRCWMEREQVSEPRSDAGSANVPGAIIGAVLGGILGHQVGGGTGRDLATIGGVVGGGVLGSKVGKDMQRNDAPRDTGRQVQRCAPSAGPARPAYWDVGYTFRGVAHQVQMTREPGDTITVNRRGEPRV